MEDQKTGHKNNLKNGHCTRVEPDCISIGFQLNARIKSLWKIIDELLFSNKTILSEFTITISGIYTIGQTGIMMTLQHLGTIIQQYDL